MADWRNNPQAAPYVAHIEQAAARHGIDPAILGSLIERESQFNPKAVSRAGARGIAQMVPKFHPTVNTADPVASIEGAAAYLASNLKRAKGDMAKALAMYNHGPTAVMSYRHDWRTKIPAETRRYIEALAPEAQALTTELRKPLPTKEPQ